MGRQSAIQDAPSPFTAAIAVIASTYDDRSAPIVRKDLPVKRFPLAAAAA
jgi:hypothetical protein